MKKLLIGIVTLTCLFGFTTRALEVQGVEDTPVYASWGRLAMKETQIQYPQAQIIDYLHIGRDNNINNKSVEKFKLWLRQGNQEFGIVVYITFYTDTEELINIQLLKEAGGVSRGYFLKKVGFYLFSALFAMSGAVA